MKKALVIGVGPLNGLGAQLAKKIAKNNFEVFVAGRTKSSLNTVVDSIIKDGNKANAVVVDTTNENEVKAMMNSVGSGLDFAIYNVGNNRPGKIVDMEPNYFKESWETCCFGGFLFSKEVIETFLKQQYKKVKEMALFRNLKKEVETGANGTQNYIIKEGPNKDKVAKK